MPEHVSIQYRTDTAAEWQHGKSVPAWAMGDRGHAAIQRRHVRDIVQRDVGADCPVYLRVVADSGQVIA